MLQGESCCEEHEYQSHQSISPQQQHPSAKLINDEATHYGSAELTGPSSQSYVGDTILSKSSCMEHIKGVEIDLENVTKERVFFLKITEAHLCKTVYESWAR